MLLHFVVAALAVAPASQRQLAVKPKDLCTAVEPLSKPLWPEAKWTKKVELELPSLDSLMPLDSLMELPYSLLASSWAGAEVVVQEDDQFWPQLHTESNVTDSQKFTGHYLSMSLSLHHCCNKT